VVNGKIKTKANNPKYNNRKTTVNPGIAQFELNRNVNKEFFHLPICAINFLNFSSNVVLMSDSLITISKFNSGFIKIKEKRKILTNTKEPSIEMGIAHQMLPETKKPIINIATRQLNTTEAKETKTNTINDRS
jgi:hypothetical protein